jgi:predicted  nucleic acid-binding Zn-ribbon protein
MASKPTTTAAPADPIAALEQAALAEREALDAETAAIADQIKAHQADIRKLQAQLGQLAAERLNASATYHAEHDRLTAEANTAPVTAPPA